MNKLLQILSIVLLLKCAAIASDGFLSFTVSEQQVIEHRRSGIIDHARCDGGGQFTVFLTAFYEDFQVQVSNYSQPLGWHLEEITGGKFVLILNDAYGNPYDPTDRCIVTVDLP